MKIRRLAALVSAVVLVLGMVTAVSATDEQQPCDPQTQNGQCAEVSDEPSSEPSSEASEEASSEPSGEVKASDEASDGQVEGLTSEPTLPPTDALSSTGTSGPDGTLPLVLVVLGVIGLSAVVLTPARAKRR